MPSIDHLRTQFAIISMDDIVKQKHKPASREFMTINKLSANKLLAIAQLRADEDRLSTHRIMALANEMRVGRFLPELCFFITCYVVKSGLKLRLNSNHLLHAIDYMPKEFEIEVIHLHYRVEKIQDAEKLWSYIDRAWARTKGQIIDIRLRGKGGVLENTPSKACCQAAITGINTLAWWEIKSRPPAEKKIEVNDICDQIEDDKDKQKWIKEVIDITQNGINTIANKAAFTAAVAWAIRDHSHKKAKKFFRPVATGAGFKEGSNQHILHEWLRKVQMRGGKPGSSKGRVQISSADAWANIKVAFEAWLTNKKVVVPAGGKAYEFQTA
jgi:hypothetical protein